MPEILNDVKRLLAAGEGAASADPARMQQDWAGLFFGSEQGMRVLGDMLLVSGFFNTSFTGNSQTYFNEGLRFFVNLILHFAGLTTAEGLTQVGRIMVAAQQRRQAPQEEGHE